MNEICKKYNLDELAIDWNFYEQSLKDQIFDKMQDIGGKLYLEIAGDPVREQFALELLPGCPSDLMKKIFFPMKDKFDILFCINADDILNIGKTINDVPYVDYLETKLMVIERLYGVRPIIVINNIDVSSMFDLILNFERRFQKKQYRVFERYKISGYPYNLDTMLSENGFGGDDHIPVMKNLILVMGGNENCGKFSTCLGQMYLDAGIDIISGYAKYSILPSCTLNVDHPFNLAYCEYSDCQINPDLVYGKAVSSKDFEKFEILKSFSKNVFEKGFSVDKYNSPIDMLISGVLVK